jgi:hypothetical protein
MAGRGAPDAPTWRQSACGAGKSLPGSTHRNCRVVRIKGGPEVCPAAAEDTAVPRDAKFRGWIEPAAAAARATRLGRIWSPGATRSSAGTRGRCPSAVGRPGRGGSGRPARREVPRLGRTGRCCRPRHAVAEDPVVPHDAKFRGRVEPAAAAAPATRPRRNGRPTRSEVPQAPGTEPGRPHAMSPTTRALERGSPSEAFACGFRRVKARRTITPSGRSGHPGDIASLLLLG